MTAGEAARGAAQGWTLTQGRQGRDASLLTASGGDVDAVAAGARGIMPQAFAGTVVGIGED
jgi:hypothetical protein